MHNQGSEGKTTERGKKVRGYCDSSSRGLNYGVVGRWKGRPRLKRYSGSEINRSWQDKGVRERGRGGIENNGAINQNWRSR